MSKSREEWKLRRAKPVMEERRWREKKAW